MRPIDADALTAHLHDTTFVDGDDRSIVYRVIDTEITIDPVKHGKWMPTHERSIFSHPDSITYVCSECGNKIYTVYGMPRTTTYCFECGAKMDKENEDE